MDLDLTLMIPIFSPFCGEKWTLWTYSIGLGLTNRDLESQNRVRDRDIAFRDRDIDFRDPRPAKTGLKTETRPRPSLETYNTVIFITSLMSLRE